MTYDMSKASANAMVSLPNTERVTLFDLYDNQANG